MLARFLICMETSTSAQWEKFFNRYYLGDILALANEYPEKRSLFVDFVNIEKFDPDLAEELLIHPDRVLGVAEAALQSFDLPIEKTLSDAHLRIMDIPQKVQIRDLRSEHISKLIAIDGLVRMATEVRPRIRVAAFECGGCGETMFITQPSGRFIEPYICKNTECGRKGSFKVNLTESEFIDAQKLRVQESPEDLRGGEQPQTLDINIEDDLAGLVSPGGRVITTGILRSYQRITREGKSTFFDIILDAVSIEMRDKEFKEIEITPEEENEIIELSKDPEIYKTFVKSIAPSIYGYEEVKEALALQLMSGIPKNLPDGARIRGDVHVLLVGDPGIAKSQLLRYIVKLAPRGIYTSGRSSSAAGLTAAAVRDEFGDGRWTLEAGALVLADQGIAAVDEMDKMRAEDRSAIHEAMEQQTVSIAKAGIMATLKSRCSLLGAANPKYGRFDPYEGIAQQIQMAPALMSRFDLIFVLKDEPDIGRDTAIATHILGAHHAGELHAHKTHISGSGITDADVNDAMKIVNPEIMPDILRKYIAYAKKEIYPIMDDEARNQLIDFYLGLRRQGEDRDSPVPVTARQLEALVRLCEASARVRLSNEITTDDSRRVIRVVESCLRQVAFDAETGKFDVDILTTGVSKSQRDKIKTLRNVIREIEAEHSGMAPKEEVFARAAEQGFEKEYVDELIKRLKTQGELYEPTPEHVRLT